MADAIDVVALLRAERLRCAKAVCERCRAGVRYNHETSGHGALLFYFCPARPIFEMDDPVPPAIGSSPSREAPDSYPQPGSGSKVVADLSELAAPE
jgi:hypothetical protein